MHHWDGWTDTARSSRVSATRIETLMKTRPDTQLPQSRAVGRGRFCGHLIIWKGALRSVEYLGRSNKAKTPINAEKVKCDGPMEGRTDGRTDRRTDRQSGV